MECSIQSEVPFQVSLRSIRRYLPPQVARGEWRRGW